MKKPFLYCLSLHLLVLSPDAFAVKSIFLRPGANGNLISTAEIIKPITKKFQNLTRRKISFIQRIVIKAIQDKLRRYPEKGTLKYTQKMDDGKDNTLRFDTGGFFLGLFLSLPGLIIAAIMDRKKKPKNIFKSALIGFFIGTAFMFALVFDLVSTVWQAHCKLTNINTFLLAHFLIFVNQVLRIITQFNTIKANK
jgi:hypothetical protein